MNGFVRRIGLTGWIIIAMVVGITLGWLDHDMWQDTKITPVAQPLATLFLRMIKSIVVPLVFSSLVVGIAGHGDDLKQVGRLAFRSIVYFELVTTVALFIGLGAVNLVRPGVGVDLATASAEMGQQFASTHTTLTSVLEHTVPTSFFKAAADNEVLQIVFFAVLFGIALAQVPSGRGKEVVLRFCEGLSAVMFKFTGLVMYFAPIGIGAALAVTIGENGLGVLGNLIKLVLTLYGALIVFVAGVLFPIALLFKVPVRLFWKWVKEPWLIAFSTASSEAALPLAMENLDKFGVPKRIVAFVLPTGYSFNLDGSTLPGGRVGVRGPGRRRPVHAGQPAVDDADADAHLEGGGRRAARLAGDPLGDARELRAPARRCGRHPRRRCADGHGAHERQPGRQLPGECRDGTVGERIHAGVGVRSDQGGGVSRRTGG